MEKISPFIEKEYYTYLLEINGNSLSKIAGKPQKHSSMLLISCIKEAIEILRKENTFNIKNPNAEIIRYNDILVSVSTKKKKDLNSLKIILNNICETLVLKVINAENLDSKMIDSLILSSTLHYNLTYNNQTPVKKHKI